MNGITLTLSLEPLDVLFFRDGRPFDAGAQLISSLPMPQTLAGALRSHLLTQLGCEFPQLTHDLKAGLSFADALAAQGEPLLSVASLTLRGLWLTKGGRPVVPTPSTLHREKSGTRIFRLDPLADELPGWTTVPRPELCPLWLRDRARTEPAGGFITLAGLQAYLDGGVPSGDAFVKDSDLYKVETRTGIAVSGPSNTAAESMIFTNGFLRLQTGIGFIADLSGLTAAIADVLKDTSVLRWGGEGRHVACRTVPEPMTWPKDAVGATTDGRLAVLITPAFLADGWHGQDWRPMAASVGSGIPISGWDLARDGPKPTRFLAPAGSVFFFRPGDDVALARPSLCDGEDRGLGYGRFVTGGWNYA